MAASNGPSIRELALAVLAPRQRGEKRDSTWDSRRKTVPSAKTRWDSENRVTATV